MLLYEVLRLYPPIIAVYQHAYTETKIGTLSLPAGVDLTLPTLLIHHDPELWGDNAEEFKPERFAEEPTCILPIWMGAKNLYWIKFCHDRSQGGFGCDPTTFLI